LFSAISVIVKNLRGQTGRCANQA